MSTDQRLRSHVLRRELHSPRSALAIGSAVAAILALAWVGTETALAALHRPALVLTPAAMSADVRALPATQPWILVTAGGIIALIGVALVVAAVMPGRRGRHVIVAHESAAVVDDEVIGSALVRAAASTAGISPDRAVATVGRRTATVRLTPNSGVPIDRAAVGAAVAAAAASYPLGQSLRTRILVAASGKVGG